VRWCCAMGVSGLGRGPRARRKRSAVMVGVYVLTAGTVHSLCALVRVRCRSGDSSVRSRVARGLLEREGEERVAESERRAFPAPCSRLVLESCRFILRA